jgi:protein-L-isoaspartate(D-aspartate) O-methyltransferase
LLQAAAVAPGERALDVAGGSGYSAAILEQMGASVVALESDAGAADAARRALAGHAGIEVVEGDLASGAQGKGPFDVILVNGAFETRPDALIAQLAEGGRLVGVEAPGSAGARCSKRAWRRSRRSAARRALRSDRPGRGRMFARPPSR